MHDAARPMQHVIQLQHRECSLAPQRTHSIPLSLLLVQHTLQPSDLVSEHPTRRTHLLHHTPPVVTHPVAPHANTVHAQRRPSTTPTPRRRA